MPGSVVGGKLGDVLIGVVDTIRGKIRAALGTRPFRTFRVIRTWSGPRVGDGTPRDEVLEIDPPPMVSFSGGDDIMGPAGRENAGGCQLSEVSLRYAEADLVPPARPLMEVYWVVRESQGQRQHDRFFVLVNDPAPRRGDHADDRSDWVLNLKRTSDVTDFDASNARR